MVTPGAHLHEVYLDVERTKNSDRSSFGKNSSKLKSSSERNAEVGSKKGGGAVTRKLKLPLGPGA